MEDKPKVHLVYKKSLFVQLCQLNQNFLYSKINKKDPRFQIYFFEWTEALELDIAMLNNQEYIERSAPYDNGIKFAISSIYFIYSNICRMFID